MKHFLSLGAGVQSSVLALMAERGLVTPKPDAAIFADTQDEPASVYTWLEWLRSQLSFPVYQVTKGSLSRTNNRVRRSQKSGRLYVDGQIPAFVLSRRGKLGALPRRCTGDFKIDVITRKYRELLAKSYSSKGGVQVSQWIGISWDEIIRMKPARTLGLRTVGR